MPHIILEYSDNIDKDVDIAGLLQALHDSLALRDGVDKTRIKTRGIKLSAYVVGNDGAAGKMAHVTLLLLKGRDKATKDAYAGPLHELMKDYILSACPECSITLEIRDMDPAFYYA